MVGDGLSDTESMSFIYLPFAVAEEVTARAPTCSQHVM